MTSSPVDGRLIRRGDQGYEQACVGRIFNARRPDRYPVAVLPARDADDVAAGVRLARERGWPVSVRSGGHSWAAWSLRDDALLIDLGQLDQVDYDPSTGIATAGPATKMGTALAPFLAGHGRSFPGGHCPTVGLGGYLLQAWLTSPAWTTSGCRCGTSPRRPGRRAGGERLMARVLGLGCGAAGGSAEILLTAALRSAEAAGASAELVRLNDLDIPTADGPGEPGDLWWLWERLVECDGLIVATPIMSRTVTARLKLLVDRLLGPNADAAIIEHLVAVRAAGEAPTVPFRVDERVLKPRVAGFLAVGGSLTPQWKTLALPLLHTTTFSMHIAVVTRSSSAAPAPRGRSCWTTRPSNGRPASARTWPASSAAPSTRPGTWANPGCVHCAISTSSCSTVGTSRAPPAAPAASWGPTPRWSGPTSTSSVLTMTEKRAHAAEIQQTAARHNAQRAVIEERVAAFGEFHTVVAPVR